MARPNFRPTGAEALGLAQGRPTPTYDLDPTGPASGASLWTWRSCGNAHIQISMTAIAPTPPISADGTAPIKAATAPARNSPSEPDEPENNELTAITRPSTSRGVRICTSDCRITTLTESASP